MTTSIENNSKFTLCWDCVNATGHCPWSARLRPVNGWIADEHKPSNTKPYISYTVKACPLFEADAFNGGLKRIPKENKDDSSQTWGV